MELGAFGSLPAHVFVGDGLLGHALLVTGSIPLEDCILSGKK